MRMVGGVGVLVVVAMVVTVQGDRNEGRGVLRGSVVRLIVRSVMPMRMVTRSMVEQQVQSDRTRGECWQQPEHCQKDRDGSSCRPHNSEA